MWLQIIGKANSVYLVCHFQLFWIFGVSRRQELQQKIVSVNLEIMVENREKENGIKGSMKYNIILLSEHKWFVCHTTHFDLFFGE